VSDTRFLVGKREVSISGGEEQGQKVTEGRNEERVEGTPTPGVFCKGKQRVYESDGRKESGWIDATGLKENHVARGH
jgi:hypothetical protein